MIFNYSDIKKKIEERFSYNINSLSKRCKISKSTLYNLFNVRRKHNVYKDMFLLLKIANGLNVHIKELIK